VGSLAGAAHLRYDNAGALKWTSVRTEISRWSGRANGALMMRSSVLIQNVQAWPSDPLPVMGFRKFEIRGVRKITTGITGLWQPSVQSDVAF